jgi:hypothetical protein
LVDLGEGAAVAPVRAVLAGSLEQQRIRLFWWLSLLYGASTMQRVRDAFGVTPGSRRNLSAEQRSYLLEVLDLSIAKKLSQPLLPLLDELTPAQQYARLAADFPQPTLSCQQRLAVISGSAEPWVSPWLRAVALYTAVTNPSAEDGSAGLLAAMQTAYQSRNDLLRQTAAWAMERQGVALLSQPTDAGAHQEDPTMLLTIEKMLILKTIDIFANTPDEILAELAALLKELAVPAGATVFA